MNKDQIHSTAFAYQSATEIYESGRPGYSEMSVFALCDHLRLRPESPIIELGAGTGKFTRVLAQRHSNLLAVEPVPAMLEKLKESLPAIRALPGTGEAIPAEDKSAEAILIANAFHWFSTEKALCEFRRVLHPGGGLGLIWNLDGVFTSAWGRIIDSWLDEIEGETPQFKTGLWRKALENSDVFLPLQEQSFSATRATTPTAVVHRVMSISFVAALPERERSLLQRRIEELLTTHPETRGQPTVNVSFDTKIYWSFKK